MTDDVDVDDDRSIETADEQLPLTAFADPPSASSLPRSDAIVDDRAREEQLDAIAESLATLDKLVDADPTVDRPEWRAADVDQKLQLLDARLDVVVASLGEAIVADETTDADAVDDGLRPENERSHVGYW
jgi:hypothetical protein